VQAGKLQASTLLAAAPKGKFFLLERSALDNNAQMYERGQKLALEQAEAAGRITVAAETWCRGWTRTEAYEATLAVLKKSNGNLSAIVAANDELASGAIQALSERKLAGTVAVSGQDADLAAVVHIIRGTQSMTIYKPLSSLAKRAVDEAVALARGIKPTTSESISNGDYSAPAILLQPIAVDQNNLGATIISDGFHTADEIKGSLAPGEWKKFTSREALASPKPTSRPKRPLVIAGARNPSGWTFAQLASAWAVFAASVPHCESTLFRETSDALLS
jgi:D-xylose transport system substrate-binding protein